MARKKKMSDADIAMLSSADARLCWYKTYVPQKPGDEPDTMEGLGVPFETTGIPPFGWHVNPYDPEYSMDQIGLSKLFADEHADRLRYCSTDKNWYVNDPKKGWVCDPDKHYVMEYVRQFKRRLAYAYRLIDGDEYKKEFMENRLKLLDTVNQVDSVLKAASREYPFNAAEMNNRVDTIAAINRIILLRRDGSYTVQGYTPDNMITNHLNTIYDPSAKCPLWDKTINDIFGGDAETINFFQIFCGQMLYGRNDQKTLAIWVGSKTNNGKTTLMTVLRDFFGDYGVAINDKLLRKHRTMSVDDKSEMMSLKGKRIAVLAEPDRGFVLDGDMVKRITGGDTLKARHLYCEHVDFIAAATIILGTNYLPNIKDPTLFDRGSIVLFHFDQSFTGSRADTQLSEKLKSEYPGILNWLLEGWEKYCRMCPNGERWVLPPKMQAEVDQYRADSDLTDQFLTDKFELTGRRDDVVLRTKVYSIYRDWFAANGDGDLESPKVFHGAFAAYLAKMLGLPGHDLPVTKKADGNRYYYGITCKH